ESADHPGRDRQRGNASAPRVAAATGPTRAFIPGDEEHAAVAKRRGCGDSRDDTAQPAVAGRDRAVVHVIAHVGCDPGKVRHLAAAHVTPELAKGDDVSGATRRIIPDVVEV